MTDSAQQDALVEELTEFLHNQSSRYVENLQRVETLITLYKTARSDAPPRDDGTLRAEILRAAVVFLHASLEDFLRTLLKIYLPNTESEKLDQVPLHGATRHGRAEKFFLGALSSHRDKTVTQVIDESVDKYLDRKTFNNVHEVVETLEILGVDSEYVDDFFPKMERLMKRRHQIVHRADRSISKGVELRSTAISPVHVEGWLTNIQEFMKKVIAILMAHKVINHSQC